ncbi:PIN domain-containing protein [Longimicrobium sp.]|uniref:PIN domain-containing protein n=1 Tax=Longimicrobium sp. TaxID=2029185 RepID=UPI003B3A6E63
MNRLRVYVDTSVIGGCLDDEFREESQKLLDRARAGEVVLVVSEVTEVELATAPVEVRAVLENLPRSAVERVELTEEARTLAGEYIAAGVIPPKMLADARHIGVATVNRVDVLASWNFKHIVNLKRVHGYNSINLREGYPLLEIRSPRELTNDGEQE